MRLAFYRYPAAAARYRIYAGTDLLMVGNYRENTNQT
jgi:hypothetical protein